MALLTTASTVSLIGVFKDSIINTCKDINKEVKFFLDDGLPDYLNSITDKFQHTKTFLYRQENVGFYDVFFPVSIRIRSGSKTVTSCEDLFNASNFVSIIGSAGSGKTMLMKHFFLESIKVCYKIPLFIELRNLNDFNGSFTDLIYDVILNNRLSPDKKILERLLESGSFILLLDGYDEIFSDKKNVVTNDLDRFIDRYSKNKYIISSRPGSGVDAMPRFNNYPVVPLEKNEIEEFIDLVLKGNDDVDLAENIKIVINKEENKDYLTFLSSPLLLSMFILTFKLYPFLPKKKSKFYWNVFDTLAVKHDSFTKKGGYQHERKSGLQNEDFEKILKWFSYKSLFEGKISFDAEYLHTALNQIKTELSMTFDVKLLIDDLTVAISILIIDGIEYRFPHKSLQEYFAVMLIKDLKIEVKEKIYQVKLRGLERSTGGSSNLWGLALEVDNQDFNKFFIIHFLKDFIGNFSGLNEMEKLKQLYEVWNIREGFQDDDGEFIFDGSISYSATVSIYSSIFSFLDLDDSNIFKVVSGSYDKLKDQFIPYLDKKAYDTNIWQTHYEIGGDIAESGMYFSPKYFWDDELEELFDKSGAHIEFSKFLSKIEEKILDLENGIKKEEAASMSLLGIE
ncbi:NACHT domain-containing protein [Pedobacter gandavensis]|uniref:NACHT domain-containing protein n=1 Tax=Pedobacter gandavensis TaxID=2679963 RepID=UPI00292F6503|nr:NACHT domain-containing protein [Pedobacter gandavensis]